MPTMPAVPDATVADVPAATTKTPGSTGLSAAEKKVPDSVKAVLKRLDKPTDDVTLDDLNSARQAIAKIEVLIEIEKHLAELDKVRHDREKDSPMNSSMIPASALQPPVYQPPVYQPPPPQRTAENDAPMPMPVAPKEALEVTQVSGGGGHYSAIIKMTGDESKTVHVGDHLADGSDVVEILPTEIVLDRKGTKRTLHVKNVNTVFGDSF